MEVLAVGLVLILPSGEEIKGCERDTSRSFLL